MRYVYAFIATAMFAGMCGFSVGAAQEVQKLSREAAENLDAVVYYRARLVQADKMMNACIEMYTEASKTKDACFVRLKACIGIEEFGK